MCQLEVHLISEKLTSGSRILLVAEARFHFTQSPIREHTSGLILKVEWETRPQIALQIFIAVRACEKRVTLASRSFLSFIWIKLTCKIIHTVFCDFPDFACHLEMRSRLTFGSLKKLNHLGKYIGSIISQLIKLSAFLFILKGCY